MVSAAQHEVLALVPALNEESTVSGVVESVRRELHCAVLVIDDGSSDSTAERARKAGAMVVRHPFNLGVGAAIRTGMKVASAQGRRYVVQLDADGQHDASEAPRLLEPMRAGRADLVVGSRFASGYDVSRSRGLAMRMLSRVVSRRAGVKVDDTTSGFRAFGPRAIEVFRDNYPTQYLSDTVEALLIGADAGLRIEVVDVRMHERKGGAPSANSLRSFTRLARLWVVILLHPYRPNT